MRQPVRPHRSTRILYGYDAGMVPVARCVDVAKGPTPDATRRGERLTVRSRTGVRLDPRCRDLIVQARYRAGRPVRGIASSATNDAEALTQRLDRMILPRELARQCIDFRLTLRRERRQSRAIPLEERTRIGRLAAAIAGMLATERRDQRGHLPRDLPIDYVQLALRLALCLLHAVEEKKTIRREVHAALPGCQPMKSDDPP